jgi:hypothetical protein
MPDVNHPWYGASGSKAGGQPLKRRRRRSVKDFLLDEEIARMEILEDVKPYTERSFDAKDEALEPLAYGGYVRRAIRYSE